MSHAERDFIKRTVFGGKYVPDNFFDEAEKSYVQTLGNTPINQLPTTEGTFVAGYVVAMIKESQRIQEQERAGHSSSEGLYLKDFD